MKIARITSNNINEAELAKVLKSPLLIEQFHVGKIIPLPTVFIHSVINNKILTESEEGMLDKLIKLGLSKIQQAITPNASGDLEVLLAFMAPNNGGAAKIAHLLEVADLSPQWWDAFFNTLGISDDIVIKDITATAQSELGKPQIPGGEDVGGKKFDAWVDTLEKVRSAQKRKRRQLPPNPTKDPADQDQTQVENIDREIASLLTEFESVKRNKANIARTASNIIRQTTSQKVDVDPNKLFETIKEASFKDILAQIGNPHYALDQINKKNLELDQANQKSVNQRIAKLALHLAKKHLREKFRGIIEDNGLLPNDIIRSYREWRKLSQIPDKSQEQLGQLQLLTKKMKQVARLFSNLSNASEGTSEPEGSPLAASEPTKTNKVQENKRVARLARDGLIQVIQNATTKGLDLDQAVINYLKKLSKTVNPKLAKALYKQWQVVKSKK